MKFIIMSLFCATVIYRTKLSNSLKYEEPFNKLIDEVIFHFSSGNLSQEWKVLETLKLKTRDEIPSVINVLKRYLLSSNREHKASVENGFNDNVTLIVSPEQNQLLLKTIEDLQALMGS